MRKDFTLMPDTPWFGSEEPGPLPCSETLSRVQHINGSVPLSPSVKKPTPSALPSVCGGPTAGGEVGVRREKATPRHLTVGVTAALLLLVVLGYPSIQPAEANIGCPESTSSLGSILLSGTCIVTTDTLWENGTITITGNVAINPGITLTLHDVTILFDPAFDAEFGLEVYGVLSMQGGGAESTNANQWDLITAGGSTVAIDGSEFVNGRYDFSNAVADVGFSTFRDSDMSALGRQHMWVGPNSTIHHNVLRGISLAEDAAIVSFLNWGESSIWGNELHLNCYGNNCMGVEVINMQEEQTDVYPGFPVVEVAWNNITWEDIGVGDWAISFDNEFSSRLYIHNNTQYVNATGETAGNCLQAGGVRRGSIYENNTCYGPTEYGIWDYIYSDTDNVFQYNWFDDVVYGGIFQMGTATVAHNTFNNVSRAGIWVCPTGSGCAGSSSSVVDNRVFNNTLTYTPGAFIARADPTNMFDNTLIQHGNGQTTQWMEGKGGPFHTVPGAGNWLYWADVDISRLQFVNTTGGTRQVYMTAGGATYRSEYVSFGTTDTASLTVDGLLDRRGSSNYDDSGSGTFLWALSPQTTEIDVLATGTTTFTITNYFANTNYSAEIRDGGGSLLETHLFVTDGNGQGSFSTSVLGQFNAEIVSMGTAPPPPPPDTIPPSQVTDLLAVGVGADYAILQWTAPGDDGGLGQASNYDIRYGTAGPLDETNFAGATPVPVSLPTPGPSDTTEMLNVTGLSPGTEFWFALRTADEVPNWSPVSNNVNLNTSAPPDVSPPAQVTDLEAVAVNSDYVVLQWRAPGDDGGVGQADAYDVRYSATGPMDEVSFGNATPVPVPVPAPIGAGGIERLNVTGLTPATDYWFALRAADEVPNWSPVSNFVTATTLPNATSVDGTPPTVTITSPDQNAVIIGTVVVLVLVQASDDTSVDEVTILLDGTQVATLNESPYAWAWSTETSSPGPHTLTAEATDPAGNVGRDEVRVFVFPPGLRPESAPPTVVSLIYDSSENRFDIQFSKPMNHASVSQALSIEPRMAYQTTWTDDSNLTIALQEAAQPDVAYSLAIAGSAADTEGNPMTQPFTYGFFGVSVPADSEVAPNLWLPVSLLLTVALATVLGLHLWTRRGARRMRQSLGQLGTRLEELNHLSQERIYRELSDLEGLVSQSITVGERRAAPLPKTR